MDGVAKVGKTLEAVDLEPENADVKYQWMRAESEDAADTSYVDIDGATSDSYTLTDDDSGKYIKVRATGTGNYKGTVVSADAVGPVAAAPEQVGAITITADPTDVSGVANDATVEVTLTTDTEDADIYYTLDGSALSTTNGTKYTAAFEVKANDVNGKTVVVKAIGVKSGMNNSAVATLDIVFEAVETVPDKFKVALAGDAVKDTDYTITGAADLDEVEDGTELTITAITDITVDGDDIAAEGEKKITITADTTITINKQVVVPDTYAITFVAAEGAESLEGATIKVYSDAERTTEVADYSAVEAGTYYYTITKDGFEAFEGSVVITDKDVEVEVALVEETPEVFGSMTAYGGGTVAVEDNTYTATFTGEIPWYPADSSVGRTEGNRVGVKIIMPSDEGYDPADIVEIKIGSNTYNWEDIKDGPDHFQWWPLVTSENQEFIATIKWNDASEQTFKIVVENATLGAVPVETYKVTFSAESNGSIKAEVDEAEINNGDNVDVGSDVVFTATPNEGYQVKEWKVNDDVVEDETGNTYTVENLAADVNVTVEFEATTQTILAQEAAKYGDVRLPDNLEKGADITDKVLAAEDENDGVEVTFSFDPNESFKLAAGKIIFSKYRTEADHDIPVTITFTKGEETLEKTIRVTVPKGTGVTAGDSTAELTATNKLEIEAVGGGTDLARVRVKLLDANGEIVAGANFDLYADASNPYGDGQDALNSAGVTASYGAASKTCSITVANAAVADVEKVKLYFANESKSVEVEDVVDVTLTPAVQLAFALGVDNTEVFGNEVKLTGDVTVNAGLEIPEGVKLQLQEKTLTIAENVRLDVEGTITGKGTMDVNGTLYASSFPAVAGVLVNGGEAEFHVGSNLQVFDAGNNRVDTFIGKDGDRETMSVDTGHVSIGIFGSGFNLTIPSDSKATIKGYHMDGDKDGYRIAKADMYTVNGTLDIDYRTEVSGKLKVNTGGVVNIAENTELYIFEVEGGKGSLWAEHGVVNGSAGAQVNNNSTENSNLNNTFMEKAIYTWDGEKWVAPNPTLAEIDVYGDAKDVEVDYGTEEDDAKAALVQKIKIRDSYGYEHEVVVTWTIADYHSFQVGKYNATGTFNLPASVDPADPALDLKVTATVSVVPMQYDKMEPSEDSFDIEVDYGTEEQAAIDQLETSAKFFSKSGVEAPVTITWSIAGYNANQAGAYTATGEITKPAGWPDAPETVTATVMVKPDPSKAKVTTSEELTAALANEDVTEITVDGTLGSDSDYTVYTVVRADVTIKGLEDAKVYGTFIIKADGVSVEDLAIQNKGDLDGVSTANRGGIYVYANDVTLKNNTITNGLGNNAGLSNAIQIMSPTADTPLSNYIVEGNELIGHEQGVDQWSSSGIVISAGFTSGTVGGYAETITATHENYEKLLTDNTFTNNKIDLTHEDYKKSPTKQYPYQITGLEITGEAKVGETLTAVIAPEEATATYRWQVWEDDAWKDIDGATGATYEIPEGSEGEYITVRADGTDHYATWWWQAAHVQVEDPVAEAKAAIKPSWAVKEVEAAEGELPQGVDSADYAVTIETSYEDLQATKDSGRTVTTYFTIPNGVTVWYPYVNPVTPGTLEWKTGVGSNPGPEDGPTWYEMGMPGHPLSADNIKNDGIVYVSIDNDVNETTFHFSIRLVDAEWTDVEYGKNENLEIKTHFVNFDSDVARQRVLDGEKAIRPTDPEDRVEEGPQGSERSYFAGWYTERPTEGEAWDEAEIYGFDSAVTEDIDLYARWERYKGVFFVLFEADPKGIEIGLAEFGQEQHQHLTIEGLEISDFKLTKKDNEDISTSNMKLDLLEEHNYKISFTDGREFTDGWYKLEFIKEHYVSGTPFNVGEDGYFEISEVKSQAKANIKPSWEVKSIEVAGTDLPEGVSDVDYKLTIGTSYADINAAQTSGRSVTTYFEIPGKELPPPEEQGEGGPVEPEELGITVYYPVWEDEALTYKPVRIGEVAFGMVGHPLSAGNIEDDGVVYIKLDEGVTDTQFDFFIRLKDAAVGWEDVVYGDQRLEVNLETDLVYAAKNETTGKLYATIEDAVRDAEGTQTILLSVGEHDLSKLKYIQLADNLTIIGTDGATLKGPRLEGDQQFAAYMGEGLTFKDIKFVDERLIVDLQDIKNLVIDNCTFANGAYLQIGPNAGKEADGITIKNTTFEGVEGKTSILIQSQSKNIVLENNTINDVGYNGIQITKLEGNLKINGNTIAGAANAAIRVATLEGAVLTITNNIISSTNTDGKYPGEVIRITGVVTDGTLTGNTSEDSNIVFESGIGRVVGISSEVKNASEFKAAIENDAVETITLANNISGNVTATRTSNTDFTVDFNTYTLTGNLNITANSVEKIIFNGTTSPSIKGDLTVTANNATVYNNIKVNGTVTISGVSGDSWYENADGNKLIFTGQNGGKIVIEGKPDSVTITEEAKGNVDIIVNAGASVATVEVKGTAGTVNITNNGTLKTVIANANISLENNNEEVSVEVTGSGTVKATGSGNVIFLDNGQIDFIPQTVTIDNKSKPEKLGIYYSLGNVNQTVNYSVESNNTGIATVSFDDGFEKININTVSAGTATITVTKTTIFHNVTPNITATATATIEVTVSADGNLETTIEKYKRAIAYYEPNTAAGHNPKTEYKVGDELDLSGIELRIRTTDGHGISNASHDYMDSSTGIKVSCEPLHGTELSEAGLHTVTVIMSGEAGDPLYLDIPILVVDGDQMGYQEIIKPSWNIEDPVVVKGDIPFEFSKEGTVYKVEIITAFNPLLNEKAKKRSVNTLFEIAGLSEGVSLYYPVVESSNPSNVTWTKYNSGEKIFGMEGHPLSANNIESGHVYLVLDDTVYDVLAPTLTIRMVDSEWDYIEYGKYKKWQSWRIDPILNPKTWNRYTSIQAAINEAKDNDKIYVGPGEYNEPIVIDKTGLTIESIPRFTPVKTVINAKGERYAIEVQNENITIKGFTLEGWTEGAICQSMGENVKKDGLQIINNIIKSPVSSEKPLNAVLVTGDNSIISGNTIEGTIAKYEPNPQNAAILISNASNITISENNISNGDTGVVLIGGIDDKNDKGTAEIKVINNIFSYMKKGISVQYLVNKVTVTGNELYENVEIIAEKIWTEKEKNLSGDFNLEEMLKDGNNYIPKGAQISEEYEEHNRILEIYYKIQQLTKK